MHLPGPWIKWKETTYNGFARQINLMRCHAKNVFTLKMEREKKGGNRKYDKAIFKSQMTGLKSYQHVHNLHSKISGFTSVLLRCSSEVCMSWMTILLAEINVRRVITFIIHFKREKKKKKLYHIFLRLYFSLISSLVNLTSYPFHFMIKSHNKKGKKLIYFSHMQTCAMEIQSLTFK